MSVLELAIGWLAPPQCINCTAEGSSLCSACSELIIPFGERCWRCNSISYNCRTCKHCRRSSTPGSVWVSTNYEEIAQQLIKSYKFGHQRGVAKTLASMMAAIFKQYGGNQTLTNYLVVPVPTATSRTRERGFDHSALLARHVAINLGLEWAHVLGRLGQSRQIGSARAKRLAQTAHSYYVRRHKDVNGRHILLVDDVVTTGATLQAATTALKSAGAAKVDALIFAKRL